MKLHEAHTEAEREQLMISDRYIKVAIGHRIDRIIDSYINERIREKTMLERLGETLLEIASPVFDIEKHHFSPGGHDMYLEDEALSTALSQMNNKYREVILLSLVAGYGDDEIADMLGIAKGSVVQYRHRGRNELNTLIYRGKNK